jgi:hypothetical protein
LNIHDLKVAYEKAIGHETSKSTVYNLLARHGWRKLMPRPFHPKRSRAVHPTEPRFIGEHDAQATATFGGSPPSFPHSIGKIVFLKAF